MKIKRITSDKVPGSVELQPLANEGEMYFQPFTSDGEYTVISEPVNGAVIVIVSGKEIFVNLKNSIFLNGGNWEIIT